MYNFCHVTSTANPQISDIQLKSFALTNTHVDGCDKTVLILGRTVLTAKLAWLVSYFFLVHADI